MVGKKGVVVIVGTSNMMFKSAEFSKEDELNQMLLSATGVEETPERGGPRDADTFKLRSGAG